MQVEGDLPSGLCPSCSVAALSAGAFRTLCQRSAAHWNTTLELLQCLPDPDNVKDNKYIYAILENDQITFVDDTLDVCEEIKTEIVQEEKPKRMKLVKNHCQCQDCGKKFTCAQYLHDHLMESTDLKRACFVCASIINRDQLINHLKQAHNRDIYDCKKCPAIFQTLKLYKRHLVKAHASRAHSCGECGRSFQSTAAFNGHLSSHAAKTCPGCDKLFRNHRCYLHHVKRCCNLDRNREEAHFTKSKVLFEVKNNKTEKKIKVGIRGSADKECICDYCGKTFAGKRFVCAHIQIVHMKNTHRPCPYCGKSFAAAHMTEHIKKHKEIQLFTCELCGIALKTKLGYIQHMRLHTGEKPYTCKYCPETFSASSRRSEHIRKTHMASEAIVLKYTCDFCPARFRLPYRLKKHVSSVHGDKNDDNKLEFECPECHIKFGSCRGLLHHSRKHQTFNLKSLKNSDLNVLHESIEVSN